MPWRGYGQQDIQGIIQLPDDEAANPSTNPFAMNFLSSFHLGVVFIGEETSMKTETLCHMSGHADVHPRMVIDGAALWNSLWPGGEQEQRLNQVDGLVW
jgi:hypothetical protein